jgi:hypothetical protein
MGGNNELSVLPETANLVRANDFEHEAAEISNHQPVLDGTGGRRFLR